MFKSGSQEVSGMVLDVDIRKEQTQSVFHTIEKYINIYIDALITSIFMAVIKAHPMRLVSSNR